jgi:hypothetical protein
MNTPYAETEGYQLRSFPDKPGQARGLLIGNPVLLLYSLVSHRSLPSNFAVGGGDDVWIPALAGMTNVGKPGFPIKNLGNDK